MQNRQPKLIAVCGTNGTGKTYLTKNILLPQIGRDYLVIDSDGMEEEWQHLPPIDLSNPAKAAQTPAAYTCHLWYQNEEDKGKFWQYIYRNVHNKVLVLDDCRDYIPANILNEPNLRNVFSRRRQKMLDIIIIQHSIKDIPKALIQYLNAIVLFNTDETPNDIATRLGDKNYIYNIAKDVKEKARTNPHYNAVIDLKQLRA